MRQLAKEHNISPSTVKAALDRPTLNQKKSSLTRLQFLLDKGLTTLPKTIKGILANNTPLKV